MLALLYDVHGNLPALEAVLEDARAGGADRYVLGGDYALFGPFHAETVSALRGLVGAAWIRGNVDRWTAHPDDAPDDELIREAIRDCHDALGQQLVGQLDQTAEQLVIDGVRYCHASPISDLRSFMPLPSEEDDELLGGVSERRLVFGHTHLPFRRAGPGDVDLINPGSVGLPLDGDRRAAYALVDEDGSVELRRVAYEIELTLSALRDRFGDRPWARRSVQWLEAATR